MATGFASIFRFGSVRLDRVSLSNLEIRIADRRSQSRKILGLRSLRFEMCDLQSSDPKANLPIRKRCPARSESIRPARSIRVQFCRTFPGFGRAFALDTSAFDFTLPPELIAQEATQPRDASRLLVVRRDLGRWEHRGFADLPELLAPGDVLVRNDSKVVPARVVGVREATGGRWEGLYLRTLPAGTWEILAKTRGRPSAGERVVVGQGLGLILLAPLGQGRWAVRPEGEGAGMADALLEIHGSVPIPPYIRKGVEASGDRSRYQTVYARVPGSVAAPTAGLHFTPEIFERLDLRGIERVDLTLHVGIGTFRPIEATRIEDHTLHAEVAELSPQAAETLNERKDAGGRVVAVGTTSARVLEASASSGRFAPFRGETALYLRPGHVFQGVDALLTNFHLPRSSLLVLVSALAGVDLIREAYAEAIRERYRFYSYGDAMLIL